MEKYMTKHILNNSKYNKKFFLGIASAFLITSSLLTLSCSNKKAKDVSQGDFLQISLSSVAPDSVPEFKTQTRHLTNQKILVFFGYNFNSDETYNTLLKILEDNYGLDENDGVICAIRYPDSFKHSIKSFYSELTSILTSASENYAGVILLGAPENTHIALSRNQDFWDQQVPYPVISLFPQDNVLGLEAACDYIIDKSNSIQLHEDIENEEEEVTTIEHFPEILMNTIDYILDIGEPLPIDKNLEAQVFQIYKSRTFHHYVDSETGLQSINHFIIN